MLVQYSEALSLQKPLQEICEEKEDGIIYSVYPKKGTRKGWHRLWCVCGSRQDLDDTCMVRSVKAGSLEKLVEHLVPALMEGDLSYIDVFLGTYRTFATTQQVLDLLFRRYGYNCPHSAGDSGPQDQLKEAISYILNTWLDEYSEDFDQPLDFPCLKLLVEYLQVNLPGSELEHRAYSLFAQLDHLEPTEAEPEASDLVPGLKAADDLRPPPEATPGRVPEADSALAPTLELNRPSGPQSIHPSADGEPVGGLSYPLGSSSGANQEPPDEVDPTPEPSQELDRIPDTPLPDGEPAGGVDPLPGLCPEPATVPPADVNPAPAPVLERHRASTIPSPALALAPGGKPAGGEDFHHGPQQELAPGLPADVNPALALTLELQVAPSIPEAVPALALNGEPAGGLDSDPGPPPETAPGPQADIDPVHAPTLGLNVAPGPQRPSVALSQEPDEEPIGKLDSSAGPPPEQATGAPADVNPISSETGDHDMAPCPTCTALTQELDEEPAGNLDCYPGPLAVQASGTSSDVDPLPTATAELDVAPYPPSTAPSQAPDEEPIGKLNSYAGPPPEQTSGLPADVDTFSSEKDDQYVVPCTPWVALTQVLDEKPVGNFNCYPEQPPVQASGTSADVHLFPAPRAELDVAPCPPSIALSQATDEEPIEKLDSYAGPPPEPASGQPTDVDPVPSETGDHNVAPCLPYAALSQAPDEEATGSLDYYSGPLPVQAFRISADFDPLPAATAELDVAPYPPSTALSRAPDEESIEKPDSYTGPPPEQTSGPPTDVDPIPSETSDHNVAPCPPCAALTQAPDEESAGNLSCYPGPTPVQASSTSAAVDLPAATAELDVAPYPPSTALFQAQAEEPTEKLDSSAGPPPEQATEAPADVNPISSETGDHDVAPCPTCTALTQELDEEPAGNLDCYPGPLAVQASGTSSDVDPPATATAEPDVAPYPPSTALSQAPDEEPIGKLKSYAGPPPEQTSGPPADVDPISSEKDDQYVAPRTPWVALTQAPDEEPAGNFNCYPEQPLVQASCTSADVHLFPPARAELDVAPYPPSTALSQAPDEEPIEKLDSYAGPPPEPASGLPNDVDPLPSEIVDHDVAPCPPCAALTQTPDEEPAGNLCCYPGPPPVQASGTSPDVHPLPATTKVLDVITPYPPSTALSQAPDEEYIGKLYCYAGPPPEKASGPPADVDPISSEIVDHDDVAPGPPCAALTQKLDEEPAGNLDCHPGPPPVQASGTSADVYPLPATRAELDVAPYPPSMARSQTPDNEPIAKLDSYAGPPAAQASGPPADVNPISSEIGDHDVALCTKCATVTQAPDEDAAGNVDCYPGSPPAEVSGTSADVDPLPATTAELDVALYPPSTALSQAPDEEYIGKLYCYAGPRPEIASGPSEDVDSISSEIGNHDVAPRPPCAALTQAPDEEPAENHDFFPGPPAVQASGTSADVNRLSATTAEPEVSPCPPSTALSQAPDEEPIGKLESYAGPPPEQTSDPPADVDPVTSEKDNQYVAPCTPWVALTQEPDEEPAGNLHCYPEQPPVQASSTSADVHLFPPARAELDVAPYPPSTALSQALVEEPIEKLDSYAGPSRKQGSRPPAEVDPIPSETGGHNVAPCLPCATVIQAPDEEPAGNLDCYPGPTPLQASNTLADADPLTAATAELDVAPYPPSTTLPQATDEEPIGNLKSYAGPPPEQTSGLPADVDTFSSEKDDQYVVPCTPWVALTQVLDEKPVGNFNCYPEQPPVQASGTSADVHLFPAPRAELDVAPCPPSIALSQATDEEPIEKLDSYAGPPPEPASGQPTDVDPVPSETGDHNVAPCLPYAALSQAPDEEATGSLDYYSGPLPVQAFRISADFDPLPAATAELDVAPYPPSTALFLAQAEEPTEKLDSSAGPPPEQATGVPADVNPISSETGDHDVAPCPTCTALTQELDEEPAGDLDCYPGPLAVQASGTSSDVDPLPTATAEPDVAPYPPSTALSQAPDEEPIGKLKSYAGPPPEQTSGPPADVDPISSEKDDQYVAPCTPWVALTQAPDEEPAGNFNCYPEQPPVQASCTSADVHLFPPTRAELDVAPYPPSTALSQAPDEEYIGKLYCYAGPPPEPASGLPNDVDPLSSEIVDHDVAPCPPCAALTQTLDEQPAGKLDCYPGPPPAQASGTSADVHPLSAATLELRVAPYPPSTALSQAPDEEPIGKLDSYAGPPPEGSSALISDIDCLPAAVAELRMFSCPASPLLAQAPDKEPAGNRDSYPQPPTETALRPAANVDPTPVSTPGLHVAPEPLSLGLAKAPEAEQVVTPAPQQLLSQSQEASALEGDPLLPSPEGVFLWFVCGTFIVHFLLHHLYYFNW